MKFAMGACRLVRIRPACITTSRGSRRFHASALSMLSKDKNELFVSKYYEGIPMGSVLEFLERKGFTNCKRQVADRNASHLTKHVQERGMDQHSVLPLECLQRK